MPVEYLEINKATISLTVRLTIQCCFPTTIPPVSGVLLKLLPLMSQAHMYVCSPISVYLCTLVYRRNALGRRKIEQCGGGKHE